MIIIIIILSQQKKKLIFLHNKYKKIKKTIKQNIQDLLIMQLQKKI
jgi:hypothetical protein